MKKILVTGGAGFIGSFLCERLLHEGHEVICLDNFQTGSEANIAHLVPNRNFRLLRHDIIEPVDLEVERIFNFACAASPIHYQKNPVHTVQTSVYGVLNLLGLAERKGARILQASTSEIYGQPEMHPQGETYFGHVNPIGPRACYDEGKRAAETLLMDFHRTKRADVKLIRIFNTYGPRIHPNDGRVIGNFIQRALLNQPIEIYGTGKQTRAFCYVSDLVEGIMRMMDCEGFAGPVNLGNPGEITVVELAEKVRELSGSKSELVFRPGLPDDPFRRNPDITLAKKELDWSPQVSLDDGIRKTMPYFEALLSGQGNSKSAGEGEGRPNP